MLVLGQVLVHTHSRRQRQQHVTTPPARCTVRPPPATALTARRCKLGATSTRGHVHEGHANAQPAPQRQRQRWRVVVAKSRCAAWPLRLCECPCHRTRGSTRVFVPRYCIQTGQRRPDVPSHPARRCSRHERGTGRAGRQCTRPSRTSAHACLLIRRSLQGCAGQIKARQCQRHSGRGHHIQRPPHTGLRSKLRPPRTQTPWGTTMDANTTTPLTRWGALTKVIKAS